MLKIQKILLLFFCAYTVQVSHAQLLEKNSTFNISNDTTLHLTVGGLLDRDNTAGEKVSYRFNLYRYYKPGFEPLKSFSIKNTGKTEIDSIAFSFNDKGNWQSLNNISDEVFKGYGSQKEIALALWKFVSDNHVYFFKPEVISSLESQDPIKFLTVYGYGDCFTMSNTVKMLNAAKTRDSLWIWGLDNGVHGITEVKIDSSYAVIDADQQAFYLKLDNKTLASYDDIRMDKYLYVRTKRFPQLYPYSSPQNFTDFKSLVSPANYKSGFLEYGVSGHTALISLRPNESISFYYDPATKYHQLIANGNGTLPAETDILSFIGRGKQEYIPSSNDIRAASKISQNNYYSVIKLSCPFVLTGGYLNAKVHVPNKTNLFTISYSEDLLNWKDIYSTKDTGLKNISIGLDTLIQPLVRPAVYGIYLKLNFYNPSRQVNVAGAMDSLRIAADFQVSKFFLPKLKTGDNSIKITSGKSTEKNLAVSFLWNENSSNHLPLMPANPLFPGNAAGVDSTYFMFKWPAAIDADGDAIKDYHFQLSDDSLMRFPLAPNFDIYISSLDSLVNPQIKPEIKDLLNDSKTYYWRVRALDKRGAWSDWSPVWKFVSHGPMSPQNLVYDTTSAGFILKWKSSLPGNKATAYKVFASNDRGFYPTDGTVIATIPDTTYKFNFSTKKYKYYRVASVDKLNNQSPATSYITIPDVLDLHYQNIAKLDSVSDNSYPLTYNVDDTSLIRFNGNIMTPKKPQGKTFLHINYINDRGEVVRSEKRLINVGKTKLYFIPSGNSKLFGEPNPPITWDVKGFENGDTLSSIDVLPRLTPDTSTFTTAGVYPFYFANGNDNYYDLVSDTADFIVKKRLLTVVADTIKINYGDPIPLLTYRVNGFAEGDNVNVIDQLPSLTTTATSGSLPGNYNIYISGARDENYDFEYKPAILIIQSKLSLVVPNPSKGLFTVYFSMDFIGKQLQILNSYGQRFGVYNVNSTSMSFDLSNQAPGMYFIKVVDRTQNKTYDKIKILIVK